MEQLPLTYYPLGDGVTAFSTTRRGGVSTGNYASFNINTYCGDSLTAVETNRQRLARTLDLSSERIVMPHQVHATASRLIDSSFFSLSSTQQTTLLEGVDALLTGEPGCCIGVSTADCIPIVLYDPDHQSAAVVHAGWRGTVQRIAQQSVNAMQQAFGTSPAQLKAVIGPGISLRHFEVGDEVYNQFREAGFDMTRIAERHDKWHIDLPACNRIQLMETGINPKHILCTGICTYEQVDDYFSARRLGIHSGRIFTGIKLTCTKH